MRRSWITCRFLSCSLRRMRRHDLPSGSRRRSQTMRPRHRMPTIFTISMVDMLCCSLGCVILLWLIKTDNLLKIEAKNKDDAELLDQTNQQLAARDADLDAARKKLALVDADVATLRIKLNNS